MLHIFSCPLILAALPAVTTAEPTPIINGVTAAPTVRKDGEIRMPNSGQYPYMVSIETSEGLCGGVIIKDNMVLTAAHCTLGQKTPLVIAGSLDVDDILAEHRQPRKVEHIFRHPEFRRLPSGNVYDVAVLKLKRGFTPSKYIDTIKLAKDDHIGKKAIVLGWGNTGTKKRYSDLLLRAGLTILRNEQCKEEFRTTPKNKVTDSMLCAMHAGKVRTTCTGDSGGPLIIPNGSGPQDDVLVGVLSWGANCNPYYPAVFARVSKVRSWIMETANI